MTFDVATHKENKKEFIDTTKKILKKKISTNPTKLKEYETELITSHNKAIEYIAQYFNAFSEPNKTLYRNELVYIRDKTNKCLGKLNSKAKVTNDLLQSLNDNIFTDDESDIENSDIENNSDDSETMTNSSNSNNTATENITDNMAISVPEYYRMASQNINRNYSGDPLQLEPFINSVKLLQKIDTQNTHNELLKAFVISKLEGKALQIVPKDGTLDEILTTLQNKISPDNSDVILGRMVTLKMNGMTPRTFTKEAELLADAFHRSLILEGATLELANKMTIKQTVKMCKNNAKSGHVKTVLDSTTFQEPKEVISKLITAQDEQEVERQVLSFQRQSNFRRNNFGNNRFNNNHSSFNNNRNNSNNQNYRQNNNNWRGNGRGRGRGNNRFNNKRGNFNVRVAENSSVPFEKDGETTFSIQNQDN